MAFAELALLVVEEGGEAVHDRGGELQDVHDLGHPGPGQTEAAGELGLVPDLTAGVQEMGIWRPTSGVADRDGMQRPRPEVTRVSQASDLEARSRPSRGDEE